MRRTIVRCILRDRSACAALIEVHVGGSLTHPPDLVTLLFLDITGSDLLADGLEDAPHQIERRRRAAADDGIDRDHVRHCAA